MTMKLPVGLDRYQARSSAWELADYLSAVIHLELLDDDFAQIMANSNRSFALNQLKKIADAFGYELVERDAEPEPLDAETVARRQAQTEQHIANAGRGHLLGD